MSRRDNALAVTGPLVKTIIFALVGVLILALLYVQLGEIRFARQSSYSALITDASGLAEASNVTANGVKIGRVDDVSPYGKGQAKITFTMDASRPLTQGVRARVRWLNLTGDRYLDLTPGPGSTAILPPGGTIPITQTTPALDLDVLLAGFDPLFQGLQPTEVNQLSQEIVTVLQGQGGTLDSLLTRTSDLTGTLADHDQVIGDVITNLNTVLGSFDAHSAEFSDTVNRAQLLVSKLNADRGPLLDALDKTANLGEQVGDLAGALRTGHDFIHELGRVSDQLDAGKKDLDRVLNLLPGSYLRLGRVSSGSGAYNIYICSLRLKLTGPDGQPFFSPQLGPSPSITRCSNDNVAPREPGVTDGSGE